MEYGKKLGRSGRSSFGSRRSDKADKIATENIAWRADDRTADADAELG